VLQQSGLGLSGALLERFDLVVGCFDAVSQLLEVALGLLGSLPLQVAPQFICVLPRAVEQLDI